MKLWELDEPAVDMILHLHENREDAMTALVETSLAFGVPVEELVATYRKHLQETEDDEIQINESSLNVTVQDAPEIRGRTNVATGFGTDGYFYGASKLGSTIPKGLNQKITLRIGKRVKYEAYGKVGTSLEEFGLPAASIKAFTDNAKRLEMAKGHTFEISKVVVLYNPTKIFVEYTDGTDFIVQANILGHSAGSGQRYWYLNGEKTTNYDIMGDAANAILPDYQARKIKKAIAMIKRKNFIIRELRDAIYYLGDIAPENQPLYAQMKAILVANLPRIGAQFDAALQDKTSYYTGQDVQRIANQISSVAGQDVPLSSETMKLIMLDKLKK